MPGTILSRVAGALFVAAVMTLTLPAASAQQFSDEQKRELHDIIRDYLINNPRVLQEAIASLERMHEEQQMSELKAAVRDNADRLFRSELDHVAGNPDGSITMVEFFDYNCGFCKRSVSDVVSLIDTDPDLRVVLKEFPILGPNSVFASRAAIAARKQGKYWEFHLAMMRARGTNDPAQVMRIAEEVGLDTDQLEADMNAPEVDQTIEQSFALANAMGIQGTPAFIIDDHLIAGALGLDALRTQIEDVRASGGCVAC